MNKAYWKRFYRNHNINGHTPFAEWCLKYMPKDARILDLGCGNGRDTYFFARKGYSARGIDYAVNPKSHEDAIFFQMPVNNIGAMSQWYNVLYSRFFLHSIAYTEIIDLLTHTHGLFIAECRAKGDEPKLYPNHPRNLIDGNVLLNHMVHFGFDILHYEKGHGLAKYKGEDPLIIRIVAKKEA